MPIASKAQVLRPDPASQAGFLLAQDMAKASHKPLVTRKRVPVDDLVELSTDEVDSRVEKDGYLSGLFVPSFNQAKLESVSKNPLVKKSPLGRAPNTLQIKASNQGDMKANAPHDLFPPNGIQEHRKGKKPGIESTTPLQPRPDCGFSGRAAD